MGIVVPASREIEICIYLYQLPVREESCTDWYWFPVREGFVHTVHTVTERERFLLYTYCTCTSLLGVRDLNIFVPASGERERFYCTYLCRLTVRERFVHFCSSFS